MKQASREAATSPPLRGTQPHLASSVLRVLSCGPDCANRGPCDRITLQWIHGPLSSLWR